MVNMILKIILLLFILITFFTFFLFYLNTHPPRYPYTRKPSEFNVSFEDVKFKNRDNINLKGWFLPAGGSVPAPTIIIAHGLGASKSDFVDLGACFVKEGFNVLLFDFRAHGESGGSGCSLGLKEQDDITAAIDYVMTRPDVDHQKIGLYGFSLGGAVAILAAAKDTRIKAVVADSPFASLKEMSANVLRNSYLLPYFPFVHLVNLFYRILFNGWMEEVEPVKEVKNISPRPVLLITSDLDEMIPSAHAKQLYSAALDPKELWVVKGASHGGTMAVAKGGYYNKTVDFFRKALFK
jgi:dipeptidyl aminopeptidase/acylaminoacyl peptidase